MNNNNLPSTIKLLDNLPTTGNENLDNLIFDTIFWQKVFSIETPEEVLKQREVGGGMIADYYELSYTIEKLNELFPGWETRNIQLHQIAGGKAIVITGDLGCPVLRKDGTRTMIWRSEVGSAEIQFKKDSTIPSNPDNVAKAAYTDWLKRAGRLFGIGWDLWEGKPSKEQGAKFEEHIKNWDKKDIVRKRFARCKKVGRPGEMGADEFIKTLPTEEQLNEFKSLIENLPEDVKDKLWTKFQSSTKSGADQLIDLIKKRLEELGGKYASKQ